MNDILMMLQNTGCRVTLVSNYSWEKRKWSCTIAWKSDDGQDSADFQREADTPEEALDLARMAFDRTARRGLALSQIVDHSAVTRDISEDLPF